jgi:hypothetical protein
MMFAIIAIASYIANLKAGRLKSEEIIVESSVGDLVMKCE